MRLFLRISFYLVAALFWLAAAAVGLEVLERARGLFSEWRYAAYFDTQNSKVYRMVSAEQLHSAENQFRLDESSAPAAPISLPEASEEQRACGPPTPEILADRAAYAARDDESRAVIMTLEGRFRAVFDGDLKLLEMEGDSNYVRIFREAAKFDGIYSLCSEVFDYMKTMKETGQSDPIPVEVHGYAAEAVVKYQKPMGVIPERYELLLNEVPPIFVPPDPPFGMEVATDLTAVRYKRNWRPEGQMATYNNYGFRDDDIVMPKPVGLFRVVCFGGSTTEEGNNNDDTYPNIMERKLQKQFGKDRVEVINCGISGIISYNERRRIEDYLELDPDLIVYYNGINDICHEHFHVLRDMAPESAKRLLHSKLLTRIYNRSLLPSDDVILDFMWQSTFRNLRAMALRASECGVPFAICSFAYPRLEHLGFRDRIFLDMNSREVYHSAYINYPTLTHLLDLHNQLVRRLCDEEGLYYIPVQENLDVGTDYFFDTCHMTPLGLELKTNIIGAYVGKVVETTLPSSVN